jgi:hypothetical protein
LTTHHLKTWPEFFRAITSGDKTFELRKDDRGYRAGDVLHLQEYDRANDTLTGAEIWVRVPYLVAGPAFGLERDYVCMAIQIMFNGGPPVPAPSHHNPVG